VVQDGGKKALGKTQYWKKPRIADEMDKTKSKRYGFGGKQGRCHT